MLADPDLGSQGAMVSRQALVVGLVHEQREVHGPYAGPLHHVLLGP